MTLLSICQGVARETGIAVPSTIVGNTADEAVTLLAFAQREGNAIARKHPWTTLQREHTFNTVAGTAYYDLPSDFLFLLTDTAWDRSDYDRMIGPLTPAEWQVRKSAIIGQADLVKRWRIKAVSGAAKYYLDPTPSDVSSIVFEYASSSWCQSSGGTAQTSWAADTDTGRVDEYLVQLGMTWRMLSRMGRVYAEERAEYDNEMMKAIARDGGSRIVRLDWQREDLGPDDADFAGNVPTWGGMGGATWGSMGG